MTTTAAFDEIEIIEMNYEAANVSDPSKQAARSSSYAKKAVKYESAFSPNEQPKDRTSKRTHSTRNAIENYAKLLLRTQMLLLCALVCAAGRCYLLCNYVHSKWIASFATAFFT